MSPPAKIAAALGVVLVLTLAVTAALFFRGELRTERAAHNATRTKYATEKAWWLNDQRSANATIGGLAVEAAALLRNREAERKAEADRFNIFFDPAFDCPVPYPGTVETPVPGQDAPATSEVVNDKTSKAAVRHINDAFVRVGGMRGD
jgi:hypothetical protein